MTRRPGRILIRLEHIPTQPPPREAEIQVLRAFELMNTEELCWIVQTVANELNRRSIDINYGEGNGG